MLWSCGHLRQLSGIERLTALQRLEISASGVTSLQPVGELVGGLRILNVTNCDKVQEEVLELPHVQPSAQVWLYHSNVKEVMLAGRLRRRVAG